MQRKVSTQVQNDKLVAERRELIVRAAIDVFRKKGFHVATTQDVASAAGITQSNLYNYIRAKDDVLYMVCASLMKNYNDVLADVASRFSTPHDRLVESVRAVVSVMSTHRDELTLLYNEAHALKKSDRRLILNEVSSFIGRFQALISEYEDAHGATRIGNTRLAANLISFLPAVSALRSWDLQKYVGKSELESGIVDFILTGLGIPPTAPGAGTSAPGRRKARVQGPGRPAVAPDADSAAHSNGATKPARRPRSRQPT